MFKHFDYLETVDSTNEYLKPFVNEGVLRMVVAKEQTMGRGRYGRRWNSPAGQGLYVSYLLYPGWEAELMSFLNRVSGLAVVKAIREVAGSRLVVQLKPPNDVLIGGKKVCGVLTELGGLNNQIVWAIVGIGVNLYQTTFPKGLNGKATSLALEGVAVDHPLGFCDCLTAHLENLYARLGKGQWEAIQNEFKFESGSQEKHQKT